MAEPAPAPRVSAVIPTRGRPEMVLRAVDSVIAQTLIDLEVVVVIDGPDQETEARLRTVADPRLRVVTSPAPLGGSGARNLGVRAAHGEWIAFLDDDDEWLPEKLAAQLALGAASGAAQPVIACRVLARTPTGTYLWPRELPGHLQPLSDYLFTRRSLFRGDGFVQTSMLMARRDLLLAVPFREELPRAQETDWLLRATAQGGAELVMHPEALSVWYTEEARATISARPNTAATLEWLQTVRPLLTRRAFADYLLTDVGAQAAASGELRWALRLPHLALREGRPGMPALVAYAGFWLIPVGLRRRIRSLVRSLKR